MAMAVTPSYSSSARDDGESTSSRSRLAWVMRCQTPRSTYWVAAKTDPSALAQIFCDGLTSRLAYATARTCLRVCAGLQILGTTFAVEGDDEYEGLGLVDVATHRGATRSVGELSVSVDGKPLIGFENHGGRTTLGGEIASLGSVITGRGNDGSRDGYRTSTIWSTYAHGPVLAMNPWFADELLARLVHEELAPLASVADRLYDQRLATLHPQSIGHFVRK